MLVSKHPNGELLMDYASGALTPALCLSVSAHLHFCETCRDRNSELTAIGGDLLAETTPVDLSIDALESVLAKLDQEDDNVLVHRTDASQKLPEDEAKLPGFILDLLPANGFRLVNVR